MYEIILHLVEIFLDSLVFHASTYTYKHTSLRNKYHN
jgi:hypothetical protein